MYTACYSFSSTCSSGTEEEYCELHQFLEDISTYMRDFRATCIRATQVEETAALLIKAEEDKRKAEECNVRLWKRCPVGYRLCMVLCSVHSVSFNLIHFCLSVYDREETKFSNIIKM